MACIVRGGPRVWGGDVDEDGHRTYHVDWLIQGLFSDGPAAAFQAIGLPLPGAAWNFGGAEVDLWAWCRRNMKFKRHDTPEGEKGSWSIVSQTFSTRRPSPGIRDPGAGQPTDPLLEPPKVSGGGTQLTEEADKDRFGKDIKTSSHERITGPINEWQKGQDQIRITDNVATLDEVAEAILMRDSVNNEIIWGFVPRTVKLSTVDWGREYSGPATYHYRRDMLFEVNRKGWDRDLLDEGTKVLRGKWVHQEGPPEKWVWELDANPVPDPSNPKDFIRFTDPYGNPMKAILDGTGRPFDADTDICFFVDRGFQPSTAYGPYLGSNPTATGVYAAEYAGGGSLEVGENYSYYITVVYTEEGLNAQTTDDSVPAGPINATPSEGLRSVRLSWDKVASAFGYKIYREGPGDPDFKLIATVGKGGSPGTIHVEKFDEANFLILGVPATL